MTRSAAIIIDQECVALIRRDRQGQRYYVFPGGQIEAGETPAAAAVREVTEELGVTVTLTGLLAVVMFRNHAQYYYRAEMVDGSFGSGCGPEMVGDYPPDRGTYTPVWINIADLPELVVHPHAVAALIVAAAEQGWPTATSYLAEA